MRVGSNPTDRAIDYQPRWTVSSHYDPKLANGGVGIAATESGITTRDRTDPALTELGLQQTIHELCVIEGRLPGRVAMLKRDNSVAGRLRRE